MKKVTFTARLSRFSEWRVLWYRKVNFKSRKKIFSYLYAELDYARFHCLFSSSPTCCCPLLWHLVSIAPHWHFPQPCRLTINPPKLLHFSSNIICKIEENHQKTIRSIEWRELVLKLNILAWLLKCPEILNHSSVLGLNRYTIQ